MGQISLGVQEAISVFYTRDYNSTLKILVSQFSTTNYAQLEDVLQEAVLTALQKWPESGVPDNCKAWITKVAKNKFLDVLRKQKFQQPMPSLDSKSTPPINEVRGQVESDTIYTVDSELEALFLVCHPALSGAEKVVLALYILQDFSVVEIAQLLVLEKATVAQRIVRAKRKLKGKIDINDVNFFNTSFTITERLPSVLAVIYQLFTEGYNSNNARELIRDELCLEAIRLCFLLVENTRTNTSATRSLLALMLYQSSRFEARLDKSDKIIKLQDQDRGLWNLNLITLGDHFLDSSANFNLNEYKLQALIAAEHAHASTFTDTNWKKIVYYYDLLLALNDSSIVYLNRAIAIACMSGAGAGLEELEKLKATGKIDALTDFYLYYLTLGDLYLKLDDKVAANENFLMALSLAKNETIRKFIVDFLPSHTS